MAKPEQVLIIEPQGELRFRGPSAVSPVTSYIKLTNPTSQKIYFKIKTTAPKRYCVRPNNGVLKPKEVSEIAVCLQPCEFNLMEKNKHKFMVQSVIAPEGDTDDFVNDVWTDAYPDKIMDYKLKCVFEHPTTNTAAAKPTAPNAVKSDTNSTNGKGKVTGDASKTSSKPMDENEEKLLKAKQEVNALRVEESSLRQENLQLKEEILKYRNALEKSTASGRAQQNPANYDQSSLSLSPATMIIAVVMVLIGYFMGKMI
ncbi:hypothetical protein HCN44_002021 [Aphidius gifuensis]|uniref:MSP domain-containing protein n=1 Tax=Aphidius gifuensis TaxID=684658 RepID=A0A835CTV5_APHGI|nr:vesicle-associated membrane protein-associated protein B-like [Aphidius gifuensis]XP_044000899.1 vesicle-associated membrane protein-associated protein B-like [Aphidius gifuensis]KAF7996389.1 hypothetical protein HCN44_002021 [Aphidius gifuensis]